MSDLLIQAMTAKQRGDIDLAKQLLSQAIVKNPHDEESWMLMADLMDDVKLRRNCLERVLAINPNNEAANLAMTKLNTSPLGPVVRGEREKPIDTPKFEKTPPFTPPFTWSGEPEQFLALGDLTFPDLPAEEEQQLPETLPTFDWANDSPEPDKTIEKIFDAVSKPELASEPPPAKEKNWLDDLRPKDEMEGTTNGHQEIEDPWLKELVGSDAEEVQAPPVENPTDFSVSSEPEWGLAAFATDDEPSDASAELNSLLWNNPNAKTDRLVILGHHSLIYANPAESDMPHILGLFNENRMIRDLLGDQARMIKLESIDRVSADPKSSKLIIDFTLDEKPATRELIFSSPQVRDEVLNALKLRLGAGFKQSHRTVSMDDKILSPLAILILVAVLAAALLGGVPLLSSLPGFESGTPQAILASVQGFIDVIHPVTIILIAVAIALACVYWLVRNLRKPSDLVILKR
ncbi:MAG: tetratricopeptide repeat protein [Anaerolineales bacterium]